MSKLSNVVLVHGAWADASSWSKVIPLLVAKGLKVTAVQLPLNSYEADVATVRRAIELEDGPVVLVGHSYGGSVVTQAGNMRRSHHWFTSMASRRMLENPQAPCSRNLNRPH
jgi:pimeloyl-ACP methyl ester carboxylesterase